MSPVLPVLAADDFLRADPHPRRRSDVVSDLPRQGYKTPSATAQNSGGLTMADDTRRCSYCRETLPVEAYFKSSSRSGKRQAYCKTCIKAKRDALRAKWAAAVRARKEGPMKRCSACGESRPLSGFHRDKSRKDGRRNQCKVCVRAYSAATPKICPPDARG